MRAATFPAFAPVLALAALALASRPAAAQERETADLYIARVEAWQTVRVKSRVPGHVARLHVGVGDQLKALDALAVVTSPERSARLGVLEARLRREEELATGLDEAEKAARLRIAQCERRSRTAQDRSLLAKAQCDAFEPTLANLLSLHDAGRATSTEVQQARVRMQELQSEALAVRGVAEDARDDIEIARSEHVRSQSALAAQRHRIDAVRAQKEEARVLLEAGEAKNLLQQARVSRVFVHQGETVSEGTELLELVDDSRVRIVARVPAETAAGTTGDAEMELFWTSGNPVGASLRVARRSGVVDADGCTAWIAEAANGDGRLLPGAELRVKVRRVAAR